MAATTLRSWKLWRRLPKGQDKGETWSLEEPQSVVMIAENSCDPIIKRSKVSPVYISVFLHLPSRKWLMLSPLVAPRPISATAEQSGP